jgi:hypothetical protein
MKMTIKRRLRLNSQTIRIVGAASLQDVQGGYVTSLCAPTWNCGGASDGCRACG